MDFYVVIGREALVRVSVVEMFVTVTTCNASKKKDVVKKCLFLPDVCCFELSYFSYLVSQLRI